MSFEDLDVLHYTHKIHTHTYIMVQCTHIIAYRNVLNYAVEEAVNVEK